MTPTETALRLSVVLTEREMEMYRALKLIETICSEGTFDCRKRMGTRVGNSLVTARNILSRIESDATQPANDLAPLVGGA